MQPELHIVKFIKEHPNWKELLQNEPYCLKIHETGKYAIFSYNQINSDFREPICREARGLIVDITTFKVVRMAFTKFFNIDEKFASTPDWTSSSATEKIDGSLMSVWYDDGWHVSTMNTISAVECAFGLNGKTFMDLFEVAARNSNLDFSKLNRKYCYTFEMVSPETRIVINYPKTELYHTLTRDMETLQEIEVDIGVQKPKQYLLTNESDYRHIVEGMDNNHEGIVVKDADGNRVKVKTKNYFLMHHLRSNMCLENAIALVRSNDYEEFVSYFPEYRELFDSIHFLVELIRKQAKDIDALMAEMVSSYENLYSPAEVRKRIAASLSGKERTLFIRAMAAYNSSLYEQLEKFADNKQFVIKYIANTRPYWVKLYETYEDLLEINADTAKALGLNEK